MDGSRGNGMIWQTTLSDSDTAVLWSPYAVVPGESMPPSHVKSFTVQASPLYDTSLVHNVVFETSLVALFVVYCLVVYFYRGCIVSLFKLMHNRAYALKVYEEQTYFFRVFLNLMSGLCVWVYGLIVVRVVDLFGGTILSEAIPMGLRSWIVPCVVLAIALIGAYQRLMIGLIGSVTRDEAMIGQLLYLRRVIHGLAVVLLTPLLLLCLDPGFGETIFVVASAVVITILMFVFLSRSYLLFVHRGVSILNWFLYLCGVEAFPISFFVLIVAKNI